ncbi:MAG: DUF6391 domain-containing protein [Anaerolineales bacterium]
MLKLLSRVRRVHALEHATLHLMPRQAVRGQLLGRSDPGGFTVYGDADTATLSAASHEALVRLQAGQADLAIHPNCGTNLAVGGLLVLLAGCLALAGGRRRRGEQGVLAAVLVSAALGAAQPLGRLAQKHLTTDARVGNLRVDSPVYSRYRGVVCHRIAVREG